ncbi:glycosyl hydrolase [Halococcoides cellulosivorans]|uniref:GH26 domain-containing protein n=1 Tax=Halococcoides cellulosivorans TaxID=1679096 RepID=A0A2R4WY27_9EURY|nr:glycosyl hydrolase [Halococcoides cellulosivorans]AWB26443.1 hypothetical protein HARCEL1_01265 [Halococcoides cellulosivorans]
MEPHDSADDDPVTDRFASTRRRFMRTGAAAGLGTAALGSLSTASAATLSNPDATDNARALYQYLQEISGEKILSGQEYEPWGIDEMDYLQDVTGRQPAVMGLDFINENFEWRVDRAIEHWNAGGIVTLMWHWGAPTLGPGYENSKGEIDVWRCFEEGTAENQAMYEDLDQIAEHLATLRDEGIPVIWRPMHELNGGWFWWSKSGADAFIELWQTVYDYFTDEWDLDNLIWVLGYADTPDADWDPGREYYDIAGADTYSPPSDSLVSMYDGVVDIHGSEIPIAYHECGTPPDPAACANDGAWWSWWMNWHTEWLTDNSDGHLDYVYNHDLTLTLDDLPDLTDQGTTCEPTDLAPYVSVDGGEWTEAATVSIEAGQTVEIGPHPTDGGSWSWDGPGVSATTREIEVSPSETSTYTATFTNSCGEQSTVSVTVAVEEASGPEPIAGTVPQDLDGDGLYEDVSGNDKLDFPDVNVLFQHTDDPAVQNYASAYDFSGDGTVDSQDVLALFELV